MKKFILIPALLFVFIYGYSQNGMFLKFSGGAAFYAKGEATPLILGAVGGQLSKFCAIGLSAGYFKFKGSEKGFFPLGLDLTITPMSNEKVSPLITLGGYYPTYNDYHQTVTRVGTTTYSTISSAKGKFMGNIGAGALFNTSRTVKIGLSGHYMPLITSANITSRVGSSETKSKSSGTTNMFAVTLDIITIGKSKPKK
jgi:hypothetical protein